MCGSTAAPTAVWGLQTRWDLFGLTGLRPPDDMDLDVDLLIDAWFKRGIALGGDIRWKDEGNTGSLLGYWVPSDNGTDVLSSGVKVDRDGEARAIGLYEQRIDLDGGWMLLMEGSSISDANFVDAYFEQMAETRREFATSGPARSATPRPTPSSACRPRGTSTTSPQTSTSHSRRETPSPSSPRSSTPASPTTCCPRTAGSGRTPAPCCGPHEYRIGRVQQNYFKTTPRELGYPTAIESAEAFGIADPDTSFEEAALAAGFTEDVVTRADTAPAAHAEPQRRAVQAAAVRRRAAHLLRQRLRRPGGPTGRTTRCAGGAPAARGRARSCSGSTTASRANRSTSTRCGTSSSRRPRSSPAGTNRHNETLPIYDYDVEGAQEGTAWRFGVNQVFQTMRGIDRSAERASSSSVLPGDRATKDAASGAGGAGGGRSVDLLRWNIDYVDGTKDTDQSGPLGTWFEYRPEESIFGNFINTDAQLLLTDATTLIGGTTYDFDTHQPSRTSAGILTDHTRDFRTFAELRFLNPLNTTYITLGGDFRVFVALHHRRGRGGRHRRG